MSKQRDLVLFGLRNGVCKGWQSFIWMVKLLVPLSLFTALLQWSGWLHHVDALIRPVMGLLSLPPAAALPLIIGMLTGIYGGIAAMVMLPLTRAEVTLIAIFLLISHNMVQEGIIQAKAGIHPAKATAFRILAATVTVVLVAPFLHGGGTEPFFNGHATPAAQPFLSMLESWGTATAQLILKVFLIVMGILTTLELFKAFGWIRHISRIFHPVLRCLGLNREAGILWMTAVVFGLAYGAAVIVEEAKTGKIGQSELEQLHLSIGINHSMIEDPTMFLALGLSAFWLWIPRLLVAIIAVRLLRLFQTLQRRERVAA